MESVQFSKPTSMLAFSIRTYESQAQYHKLELTVLRKKIDGAKQRCLALGDTHSRPELILFSSQSRWDCWWVKTLIVLCSNSAWQAKWLRWRIRILGGRERDRQKDRGVILWRAASQNCQGPLKKQSTKIFLSNPFTTNIYIPSTCDEADADPTSDLGTNFDGLADRQKRDTQLKDQKLDQPQMNKYIQDSHMLVRLMSFSIP